MTNRNKKKQRKPTLELPLRFVLATSIFIIINITVMTMVLNIEKSPYWTIGAVFIIGVTFLMINQILMNEENQQ